MMYFGSDKISHWVGWQGDMKEKEIKPISNNVA
jgi:hypothetical protein